MNETEQSTIITDSFTEALAIKLTSDFKLCKFDLNDGKINFKLLQYYSSLYEGTIQSISTKEQSEEKQYICLSDLNGRNYYFRNYEQLHRYLDSNLTSVKEKFSRDIELYLHGYIEKTSPSFNVVNEEATIFTNIITLRHRDNRWYKKLLGTNRFFTIFVSGFLVEGVMLYCISSFSKDGKADVALCSTSFVSDIPLMLNSALKNLFDFEFWK